MPHAARPLPQLLNDLVAVHRALGEERKHRRADVTTPGATAVAVMRPPAREGRAPGPERSPTTSALSRLEVTLHLELLSSPVGSQTITIYREPSRADRPREGGAPRRPRPGGKTRLPH